MEIDKVIQSSIVDGEEVLWCGKPQKKCYVWGAVLKMLPIALIWLLVDGGFIIGLLASGAFSETPYMAYFLVPFFLFHLMPVWIWIGSIIKASAGYKKIIYCITSERIIIKQGLILSDMRSVLLTEIDSVNLKEGFLDKIFKTGDIYCVGKMQGVSFNDVENVETVYATLNQAVMKAKDLIKEKGE